MAYNVLKSAEARKKSIIEDTKSVFNVSDNLNTDFSKPTIELCSQNTVRLYDHIIKTQAFRHDVDVDLIRAIMYMETSHGWYDKVYPLRKTILPMNIHMSIEKDWGFLKRSS